MTLEEIFKSNKHLLNEPEVKTLIEHVSAQHNKTIAINKRLMKFKMDVSELCFKSDQFLINGEQSSKVVNQIIELI